MEKSYDNNYEEEVINHSFYNSKNNLSTLKKDKNDKIIKENFYEENNNKSSEKEYYISNINEKKKTTDHVNKLGYNDNDLKSHISLNENKYMFKPNNANENVNYLEYDLNIYSNGIHENLNDKKNVNKKFVNKNSENINECAGKINDFFIAKENISKEYYDIHNNKSVDVNQNNNINEVNNLKLNDYNITKNDLYENKTSINVITNIQNYDINNYGMCEPDIQNKHLLNSDNINSKCTDKNINNENSSLNDVINKYLMNTDNKEDEFENKFSYFNYVNDGINLMNTNSNSININNLNNNINEIIDRNNNNLNKIINNVNNINGNPYDSNYMNNFLANNNNNNNNNLDEWRNLNNNFSNFTKGNNLIFDNDININKEKEKNMDSSRNIDNTSNYIDYINMLNSSQQNFNHDYSYLNNNFNEEIKFSENANFIHYNSLHNEKHNKLNNFYVDNNFLDIKNQNSLLLDTNDDFNKMKENSNDQKDNSHEDKKKYLYEKQNNIYMSKNISEIQDKSYGLKKDEFHLNRTSKKKEGNIIGNNEKESKCDEKKSYKYDDGKNKKYDHTKYNKYDSAKYSKYDNRKDHGYNDKKHSRYDDKKDHKYNDKKCSKYYDKKDYRYNDKKHSKYDDKKDHKYNDKKYSKYDEENDKHKKKYECNIFDDDCYFVKCEIYGKEKIIVPDPLNNIEDLNSICDDILYNNICTKGYNKMTTVQKYSIPIIKKKINLIASSQTGSGKTFSFLCPIISNLKKDEQILRPHFPGSYACISPLCLVLCPTRELAIQIYNEVNSLTKNLYLVSMVFYGGETMKEQIAQINEKQADIIISTPGRLLDLLNNCKISLSFIKYLVFDEADEMISLGFKNQMDEIIFQKDLCPNDSRQTICFTATLSDKLKDVMQNFIATPYIYLDIKQKREVKNSIKQIVKYVPMKSKLNELLRDIRNLQGQAIIFVELRSSINHIFNFLKSKGFDANYLHGRMNQVRRKMVFEKFREKAFQILIATSIAARGLDFPDLELVINYDLPSEFDQYMHRIGRTGRIGKNGVAINYFNSSNKKIIDKLIAHLKKYDQTVPNWLLNFNK
ncbi:DEAD/DEAH box helicase, putative [Plasmodium gallinaceum]|uniref:RNA helicase n=1 Tax=Plasmodium gallinaceum TaxID=5849 RepID=A0A1J1GXN5_PLAGA|nr:DEAD/DEAH box helicase, putative [Plasmodium gallinaceum]CRG97330.1 DEAD/DEAH box helicase, putative [Plasmodium gallinaceum]